MRNTLILIPARRGSKGLPGKNLRIFNDKPLIQHTIEFASKVAKKDDIICVSTDSTEIIELCKNLKINIDFKRPNHLASDKASMDNVILHAIEFYNKKSFEQILLLQPTTPFRILEDYFSMEKILLTSEDTELVASVKKVKDNPYFNMFKIDKNGFLEKILKNLAKTRQECPEILALNGSMYLFKRKDFQKKKSLLSLKTVPYLMTERNSCDIDTINDFEYAQFLINNS